MMVDTFRALVRLTLLSLEEAEGPWVRRLLVRIMAGEDGYLSGQTAREKHAGAWRDLPEGFSTHEKNLLIELALAVVRDYVDVDAVLGAKPAQDVQASGLAALEALLSESIGQIDTQIEELDAHLAQQAIATRATVAAILAGAGRGNGLSLGGWLEEGDRLLDLARSTAGPDGYRSE